MPNNISQVVLDHHQKDMVLINWAMSTILIGYLIFFNIPGRLNEVWNIFCNHILKVFGWLDSIGKILQIYLLSGVFENYHETTQRILDILIRKGIGMLVFALLNSFLVNSALQYLQVSLWNFIIILLTVG